MCFQIFEQIARSLEVMHSKKIAHYDLKPENIILDQNFKAKIIDYGLCEKFNAPLYGGKGSEYYMAPEMRKVFGKKCILHIDGSKADMYSLGIILFVMYFGRMPPLE